jgi:hypothetical protein
MGLLDHAVSCTRRGRVSAHLALFHCVSRTLGELDHQVAGTSPHSVCKRHHPRALPMPVGRTGLSLNIGASTTSPFHCSGQELLWFMVILNFSWFVFPNIDEMVQDFSTVSDLCVVPP